MQWIWWVCFVGFVHGVDVRLRPRVRTLPREKECYGSSVGFSFSGTREYHYESLRRRYTGCTYVQGNLEITNLHDGNTTFDLGFLSTIRVVTGYVLFGLLNVETIPLTSLRLIRADSTMPLGDERYAMVVALTAAGTPTEDNPTPGLKELQLPRLREISRGKVLFSQNPLLCYQNTIDWSPIARGPVIYRDGRTNPQHCGPCRAECTGADGAGRCWGAGRHMCQRVERVQCHTRCRGRCFNESVRGCCHQECAIGCSGSRPTHCLMCRHFRFRHECVPTCPAGTYPMAQECVEF